MSFRSSRREIADESLGSVLNSGGNEPPMRRFVDFMCPGMKHPHADHGLRHNERIRFTLRCGNCHPPTKRSCGLREMQNVNTKRKNMKSDSTAVRKIVERVSGLTRLPLWIVIVLLAVTAQVQGATLHLLIITDTNSNIGESVGIDGAEVKAFFETHLGQSTRTVWARGENVTEQRVMRIVAQLPIHRDDSVFCYYSGHGAYDPKHDSNQQAHFLQFSNGDILYRHELLDAIKRRKPKLSVLITDCCNVAAVSQAPPSLASAPAAADNGFLKYLFLEHEGWVDMTSSSQDQFSFCEIDGRNIGGGVFTNAFLSVLKQQAHRTTGPSAFLGWDQVFKEVRRSTARRYELAFPQGESSARYDGDTFRQYTQTPFMFSTYGSNLQSQRNVNGIRLGVYASNGRSVQKIVRGSAAGKAGIRSGDRLIAINGNQIHSRDDFLDAVKFSPRRMQVVLRRGKKLKHVNVILPY